MGLQGILLYCGRAAVFAAAICGLYGLYCLILRRRLYFGRLAGIAYVAALIQITVLRGGVDWERVFEGLRVMPQLVPLKTTLGEMKQGLWPLIYHTVGNLIWFVPLGMLLAKKKAAIVLLTGAVLSAGIECMQFLLMTGSADIDDVILNATGALIGWLLMKGIKKNGFI